MRILDLLNNYYVPTYVTTYTKTDIHIFDFNYTKILNCLFDNMIYQYLLDFLIISRDFVIH